MTYIRINVAKDNHNYIIANSDEEILFKSFTIPNNKDGVDTLYQWMESVTKDLNKIKVGLEANGHYSHNLLGLLLK